MKKRNQIAAVLMAAAVAASLPAAALAEEAGTVTEAAENGAEAGDSGQSDEAENGAEAGDGEQSSDASSLVASSSEMTTREDVVDDSMVPIYGTDVEDGVYEMEVLSSSSMFRIIDCELTVADGEMTAVITLNGDGYLKLFMGTGLEAVEAEEEDYITFVENEEGKQTYTVPVEALDMGIDCAAWSKNKEKWYDRTLVFPSASLPMDALKNVAMTTLEDLGLEDGVYLVDVTLEGGSGKSTVQSPTTLTVADGVMTATIGWASPYYDYMLVGEEKYLPVNTEGDSVFEIPVTGMDYKMPVTADTVAMSVPHEIDYTLYFDSASIEAQ